jgi:ribosomal protein S18 acetylase RimI-like enzyme
MNDFKIRQYLPEDEKDVINLWSGCNLIVPHNNPKRDIERKLKVNPEWFLVGEINGKIIGTCMAGYEGHRGWINYLAIAPTYQRRGLASRMMKEAERLLRNAGCPKINLQVRASNVDVIEFYKSIGFSIDAAVSMGKRLEKDHPL